MADRPPSRPSSRPSSSSSSARPSTSPTPASRPPSRIPPPGSSTSIPTAIPRRTNNGPASSSHRAGSGIPASSSRSSGIALGAGTGTSKRTVSQAGMGTGEDESRSIKRSLLSRPPVTPSSRPSSFAPPDTVSSRSGSRPSSSLGQASAFPPPSPGSEDSFAVLSLRSELEAQKLAAEQKYEEYQRQLSERALEIERIEREKTKLGDVVLQVNGELEDLKGVSEADKSALQGEVADLRRQLSAITASQASLSETYTTYQQASRAETSELRSTVSKLTTEVEDWREQSRRWEADRARWAKEKEELERDVEESRNKAAGDRRRDSSFSEAALREEMHRQVAHLTAVERENADLRAQVRSLQTDHSSVHYLLERKRDVEHKLRLMSGTRERLAETEELLEEERQKTSAWERLLSGGANSGGPGLGQELSLLRAGATAKENDEILPPPPHPLTPDTLPRYLSSLRSRILSLAQETSTLRTSTANAKSFATEKERALEDAVHEVAEVKAERDKVEKEWVRAEKRVELRGKEVAFLREQLKAYDVEESTYSAETFSTEKAARIAGLEQLLQEHKALIDSLAAELERVERGGEDGRKAGARGSLTAEQRREMEAKAARVVELEKALSDLQETHAAAVKEVTSLDTEVGELRRRLGRGEYDASSTKVLSLIDNPASRDLAVRTETLEALRKENQQLLARLEAKENENENEKEGEEAGGQGGDGIVPQQTVINLRKEIERLEEVVAQKEKMLLRLRQASTACVRQIWCAGRAHPLLSSLIVIVSPDAPVPSRSQVFSAKALEFREAVESLFGYKMKFLDNGKVALTSVYARGPNSKTSLVFRSDENDKGTMRLLESGDKKVSRTIRDLIEYWIAGGQRESIPGFLAALTCELYESVTQAARAGWRPEEEEEEEGEAAGVA